MNKIPVGATVSGAYHFAFADILSVLGIAWFPHLLFAAIVAAAIFALAPGLPSHVLHGEFGLPLLTEYTRIGGIVFLASLLAGAITTAGLQQKALSQTESLSYFYFSLGAPVWRLIGAHILAILVLILIIAVSAGIVGAVAFEAVKLLPRYGTALAAVAVVAGVFWAIYATVRLLFLLPAVVVAEGTLGLSRSWQLAAGSFWRIVLISFVVFVPTMIVAGMISNAIVGPQFLGFAGAPHIHAHMTHKELVQTYVAMLSSVFKGLRGLWPYLLALNAVHALINLGLSNGMVASAYLAVSSHPGGHMPMDRAA